MFRVFVVGGKAYVSEESDSVFRKNHNLRTQDMELIASYATREALTSKQFERALKQYNVTEVIDETKPVVPKIRPLRNIFRDYPPEVIAEYRRRHSERQRGRTFTDEAKAKMAAAKRNRPSNNKGRRRSIVANIEQSNSMKGKQCVKGYITYSEPYSGKQIRLPPGVNPPPGYIKGMTTEEREDRRRRAQVQWYMRKNKLTDR